MMPSNEKIVFEHRGIGEVLIQNALVVPLNQREYSWEKNHVEELFQDYIGAMDSKQGVHFLGTIVLTKGSKDTPEVSDGQQRLATTTVLLAAIRDYYAYAEDYKRASTIESRYLMSPDLETTDTIPKLTLNVDDNEFFKQYVLIGPEDSNRISRREAQPKSESHRRIKIAADFATGFIRDLLKPLSEEHKNSRLINLVNFITEGAQVIVLRVPDDMNAFTMFETLNDRGLKASQADLIKNYLLGRSSSDRLREAQQYWARMIGILDTLGLEDVTLTFLHHLLITKHGFIKASDIFAKVKETANSPNKAIEFLKELADSADDYAALLNPNNTKWNSYGTQTSHAISTLHRDLNVKQIRPLMFAVVKNFSEKETSIAFRYFVCWSVRMLIVGGYGGILERNYGNKSYDVANGKIKTANELAESLRAIIPTDAAFEDYFSVATVSTSRLGRYYLRALEVKKSSSSEPELVPSNDEQTINLEHILPENPQQNWPNTDAETASAFYKRLGNMALLQATKNSILGNMSFADKKPTFEKSEFALTSEVTQYDDWGKEQIEERQREMAALAVKTWPITR